MNLRSLEKQTEKLNESMSSILEYTQKRSAERANAISSLKTISIMINTLNTKMTEAKEKQKILSEKEYKLYILRFLSSLTSEDYKKSIFSNLNSQLIYLKDYLNDLGLEVVDNDINETLIMLETCQLKWMQLTENINDDTLVRQAKHKVRHPSASSSEESCESSEDESQSTESKKRKFEEVSISDNPDTLFASDNKRPKTEDVADNFAMKR